MALAALYRSLFRRTSTFALTVVVGAVLFERVFDQGADALYSHLNEGVRSGLQGHGGVIARRGQSAPCCQGTRGLHR
uniref:Complex III subunit 9 n=1 Tax=Leptobrachium leishanense TaxID=445787 RepID=A0A8C5LUV1_9ANUR